MKTAREIADFLEEYCTLLELSGADSFRLRAYSNAVRIFENLEADLEDLIERDALTEIKGVGKSVAALVGEYAQTETATAYEKLKAEVPQGLLDMLRVPGLGPRKIVAIRSELQIEDLDALEQACRDGRLDQLKGFGKKTQANILKGIEHIRRYQDRSRVHIARESAVPLLDALRAHPSTQRVEVAGSLRRRRETVKDIDFVLSSQDPEAISEFFTTHESVAEIIQHGQTKSAVRLHNGLQADLRVVADDEFPYILHHFTGSKEHNVELRARAIDLGLKINEYGLFRGEERIDCIDETDFLRALGLDYIPPELREGLGEIEAAAHGSLPELVCEQDVRGMLHLHSTYSDGADSIEAMAQAVQDRGYAYMGMSDHSQSAAYAGGLKVDAVLRQWDEIDALNDKIAPFHIFKGIESDILGDGSLDYEEGILDKFDFVVASVHSQFNLNREAMTTRIVRAIEHPATTIVGHLTGRLLLDREGYDVDIDAIIEAAADKAVSIEINAHPARLDIDWRHVKKARYRGVKISVNTDAHRVTGLDYLTYGIGCARKGWLRREDVLNTLELDAFRQYLHTRRNS
jgi:DNA polymerase (family 10)